MDSGTGNMYQSLIQCTKRIRTRWLLKCPSRKGKVQGHKEDRDRLRLPTRKRDVGAVETVYTLHLKVLDTWLMSVRAVLKQGNVSMCGERQVLRQVLRQVRQVRLLHGSPWSQAQLFIPSHSPGGGTSGSESGRGSLPAKPSARANPTAPGIAQWTGRGVMCVSLSLHFK